MIDKAIFSFIFMEPCMQYVAYAFVKSDTKLLQLAAAVYAEL